jgi:hypothetical protein
MAIERTIYFVSEIQKNKANPGADSGRRRLRFRGRSSRRNVANPFRQINESLKPAAEITYIRLLDRNRSGSRKNRLVPMLPWEKGTTACFAVEVPSTARKLLAK